MTLDLSETISRWTATDSDQADQIWDLYQRLRFLERQLYEQYEPTRDPMDPPFGRRLERWLANVSDDDERRILFLLLDSLYFIGRDEFEVLHTSTFNDIVLQWLVDRAGLTVSPALRDHLDEALSRTWFCPSTDSMEIARFCHLNQITSSPGHRPDWRSLAKFGDAAKIEAYCVKEQIRHLVLLEDFVGTGAQIASAAEFAGAVADEADLDVLVCPLVITSDGLERLRTRTEKLARVDVIARLVLEEHCHVRPEPPEGGGDPYGHLADLRAVLLSVHDQVVAGAEESAFGFGDLGTLGVMFTNCPNNVPPVVHYKSPSWYPLFPRSVRSS